MLRAFLIAIFISAGLIRTGGNSILTILKCPIGVIRSPEDLKAALKSRSILMDPYGSVQIFIYEFVGKLFKFQYERFNDFIL